MRRFERVAVLPLVVSVGVDDQVDGEVGAVEAELRARPWLLEVDVPTEELVASGPPEEPSRVPIARTRYHERVGRLPRRVDVVPCAGEQLALRFCFVGRRISAQRKTASRLDRRAGATEQSGLVSRVGDDDRRHDEADASELDVAL